MKTYTVRARHSTTGNYIDFTCPATLEETEKALSEYLNSRAYKKQRRKRFTNFKIEART